MAIGDLSRKVGGDELQRTRDKLNPPEYEQDFAPTSGGDAFSDLGSDLFDSFGSDSGGGASSGASDSFGGFGGFESFGTDSSFGGSGMGSTQTQQEEKKADAFDRAFDYSLESLNVMGKIIVELVSSIKNRNLDDWCLFSNRMMMIGVGASLLGILTTIIGTVADLQVLRFTGMSSQIVFCGGLCLSMGLITLGGLTIIKLKVGDYGVSGGNLRDFPDVEDTMTDSEDTGNDFDEEGMEDLDFSMNESLSSIFGTDSSSDGQDDIFAELEDHAAPIMEPINFDALGSKIQENVPIISRKFLFDTFKDYYPLNTPGFSSVTEIEPDSDTFLTLLSILNNAMAAVAKVEPEMMNCELLKVTETKFCYELEFKRTQKLKNIQEMQRELENYFKSSKDDFEVTATVDIVGSSFIATITKGNSDVVTLGDCLQLERVQDYYKDEGHKMPFIMGVDMYGNPLVEDAKKFPTMMIVGIARSGKSWYVDGIIMNLASFNPPDAVQFLIIDPKESTLFKTIGLLPHTCGVHPQGNEMAILSDLINKEGKRRKKLLSDNGVEDIWALRKKGIMLPFLYLVIDEVITIINKQKENEMDKSFLNMLLTVITQLPSQGIGVLFVPHRAQGIIDKTSRSMVPFAAAVRAKAEMVNETLGTTKWSKVLVNPGDIALNTSDFANGPKYVRGTGITLTDDENLVVIANIAKAYYKMGVELPDMTSIGCGYNRDEDEIRARLDLQFNKKVQFNIDDIT